jgi:predicted MPP superfamily phosphohydrolase
MPPSASKIRVVQISDVHLGVMIGKWRLQRMLASVSAVKPDILVATGDVVDGQIHRLNGLADLFRTVAPRYGSFAVLGNHEFYAGLNNSLEFLRGSGFQVLRKESRRVLPYLAIAGVDDSAAHRWGDVAGSDERGLLVQNGARPFTILLKHRPAVDPESAGKFDLQLSGHVHKGQIFPFNLLTYFFFPVRAGVNRLNDGSLLYVSSGTGTWGPPVRFLAPPEVTVIDIISAESR